MDVVSACIQKPGSPSTPPWLRPRVLERCSPKGMCRKARRKYLLGLRVGVGELGLGLGLGLELGLGLGSGLGLGLGLGSGVG